jgi:excisionase family DNA binding protein
MKPLLKAKDVAHILGVDVKTVWRMTKDGRLKSIVLGPKTIRFDEGMVKEMVSEWQTSRRF